MQIFIVARAETETTYRDELPFVQIDGRLIPLTQGALERLAETGKLNAPRTTGESPAPAP